jgi:hypothetical protein
MINEIAQWAVIGFLGVFVFGLTRLLGQYMVAPKEQQALDEGPRIGKRFPLKILTPRERAQLDDARRAGAPPWMLVIAVDEDCPGCESMVKWLERRGAPKHAVVLAISRKSDAEHEALLRRVAAVTIIDEGRFAEIGLRTTPFVIVLDADMRVVHKQITADLPDAVARWRANARKDSDIEVTQNGASGPSSNGDGAEAFSVVTHEGTDR